MTETIHEAVAHQALLQPDAPAVICGDDRITYAQLNERADSYIATLRRQGVRPGSLVPVLLPRSVDLVVTLLAILKCGAGYAALDRRWPAARIRDVVDQMDSPVVITQVPSRSARTDPLPGNGEGPAAVYFTSGTTGRPKGVVSPHRAAMRLFGDGFSQLRMGRSMPLIAQVSWDAFTLELWGMLVTGGTTVIVGTDYFLPEHLRRLDIDTVFMTTALFEVAVDEDLDCFTGLGTVLTGGERMSPDHARRFLRRFPTTNLINGYGPVESCVFATAHVVSHQDCARPGGVPIGIPLPHTGVHILDGTTAAASGEICLSGPGLAHGYLNSPALTRQRFVTVDIDGRPERVYRTGDLGLLDEDGVLHFRGRLDRQVKIAGHRVEPAEIEVVARRIPGVLRCHVVPVPAANGGYSGLALYYTAGPTVPAPAVVRRQLAARLPSYLVPGKVRRIDAFPTNATGKTDTRTLLEL